MLVLSRFEGETMVITVGSKVIRMTVLQLRNGQARLGFDADKDVSIMRAELLERIRKDDRENQTPQDQKS